MPIVSARTRATKADIRPVPGLPGYYACADGTIWCNRSCARWGSRMRHIKPWRDPDGYEHVTLVNGPPGSPRKRYPVHSLVLLTFVGPRPDGQQACHNDSNPSNNALSNLRWDTQSGNFQDKKRHGTELLGEDRPHAILTRDDVREIRRLLADGVWERIIAKQFNTTQTNISAIKLRRTWAWLD